MTNIPPYSDGIHVFPPEDKIFEIDLNERTIITPTFLSVEDEHKAEIIYFLVDRYYDYKDLAMIPCVIEYITAAGESGVYMVPFYDITSYKDENKMILPWRIEGDVTNTPGPVQFALRFFELKSNGKIGYNLKTKIAVAQVLKGMKDSEINAKQYNEELSPILFQIADKLNLINKFYDSESENLNLYWEE